MAKIDERYIVKMRRTINGEVKERAYVTFAGLLDAGHQEGLKAIETELIVAPGSDNNDTAIVRARITTTKGTFTGIGDANKDSIGNEYVLPHKIRMAETRALARALRFATNTPMSAIEELHAAEDNGNPATTGQINYIKDLMEKSAFDTERNKKVVQDFLKELHKADVEELTFDEAHDLLTKLDRQRRNGNGSK